jgi:hypothetical protein
MKLRDYQVGIANKAKSTLDEHGMVYISAQVRTGKTLMSLETARLYGATNVLFLTKKKAISSIKKDYFDFSYNDCFNLSVCNDESMHKIEEPSQYDLIIHDEHHRFGSFPKPGKYTTMYKKLFKHKPMIFLSGTMSPESYSQLFHQFWISDRSPWRNYTNFYKWANDYVNVTRKIINGFPKNDYSDGIRDKIMQSINPYMITFTQEEAGFSTKIDEEILYVDMSPQTSFIARELMKDKIVQGKTEVILADTGAKMMQKLHQIWSGTVKFESGNSTVLDKRKGEFIKEYFKGQKIGIFYVFKEEYNLLLEVFGADNLTNDLDEFNATSKNIALQVVSGREGISLRAADSLVFYNIAFSAVSYWQARDRLSGIDRKQNKVYWIFSRNGIEKKIYKAVQDKKNYTLSVFKKDVNNDWNI